MVEQKDDNVDTITSIFYLAFKNFIRRTKLMINGICLSYEEFFVQSEHDTCTSMRYSMTTDVFGITRTPGIKRRPIYGPWPNLNSYVAAVLWKSNETNHKDLKCCMGKARRYKHAWKPSATYDMQNVIDDHDHKIKAFKAANK